MSALFFSFASSLAAAFGGGINAFFYSVAGAILSLGVMLLLKEAGKFSILGVSMAGGIFHNLGQVIVAVFGRGQS